MMKIQYFLMCTFSFLGLIIAYSHTDFPKFQEGLKSKKWDPKKNKNLEEDVYDPKDLTYDHLTAFHTDAVFVHEMEMIIKNQEKGNERTNEKSGTISGTIDKMKEEDQRKTKQSEKEISQSN
ncbi:uncharacterized protein [Mytilus edulis]|uniref:uncharacterized protein n=1 Tax=Mytilus edulis TaxID=6550 RepID=UPI0039F01367